MSKRNRSDSPTKSCTADGCDKPLRARRLCATHYNQQHQPNRHRKVEMICPECGQSCMKQASSKFAQRFCSLWCRDAHHRRNRLLPVLWVEPKVKRNITQPVVSETVRMWVSGTCRHCGARFIDRQLTARFCSICCGRRWHGKRRKEKAGYIVSAVTRALVYARDAGVCQLCLTAVDMSLPPSHAWGPTVDHIICVSWTLLPDHRASNLRLAHRWCNSKRADERYAA